MINWNEVTKQDFMSEMRLDLSEFFNTEIWVTIKKIPYHIRERIFTMTGRKINQEYKAGELVKQEIEYTKEYNDFMRECWKDVFKHGVDENKHNIIDSKTGKIGQLKLSDWEELGRIAAPLVKHVEGEILKFNGFFDIDKKK